MFKALLRVGYLAFLAAVVTGTKSLSLPAGLPTCPRRPGYTELTATNSSVLNQQLRALRGPTIITIISDQTVVYELDQLHVLNQDLCLEVRQL